MKERPILFSTPMVQAILEGRKSQTRRVLNPQPEGKTLQSNLDRKWLSKKFNGLLLPKIEDLPIHCPYGQVGDNLWVREKFRKTEISDCGCDDQCNCNFGGYEYFASTLDKSEKWKPSIHMPRSASRLLLEITNIRVEKLNQISRADAVKEGLHQLPATGRYVISQGDQYFGGASSNPVEVFSWLWESINGLNSWSKNPWVWVVEFKVVKGGES
ncbi:hypothetical protein [Acinetobacter wuhouensis]|uniref:Morphogenetic protein n=1 Tax=Acinetobacter wuhouensis TaxID=1879050 RepID=A0A3G2T348_9GAMM|nr:hypothetical protein [Acinetobacter wuhouensis]AYO54415.1 hypothetical protein CDG68_12545 [Acinetobacter wuhouensis]